MKLLNCEFLKTRKRYVLITTVLITLFELCWIFYGKYSDDNIRKGWMLLLYQLPLINAIFMPLLSIIVASRLSDIEHKGYMLKQLCCITPKGRLYDAKLVYGLGMVLASLVLQFAGVYIGGKYLGFGGTFPLDLYVLYWIFTICASFAIYIFQHTLSLLFKNQTVPFFVGVIGQFFGLFSMFLPQLPWLRYSLLWGYFGVLQFVGGDWDRETRISTFYTMEINWTLFAVLIAGMVVLYLVGKKLFVKKEV